LRFEHFNIKPKHHLVSRYEEEEEVLQPVSQFGLKGKKLLQFDFFVGKIIRC
jgi:hypothetical protein